MNEKSSIRMMVMSSLFAALTAVGAYIAIPIGPVPIVLANFFVMCAGLLLGKKWAPLSMIVYLGLGFAGLPVFSGGASGPAAFAGPTGGFLIAYVLSALTIAIISGSGETRLWKDIAAVLAGIAIVYLVGVPWLKISLDMDWAKAMTAGMLPFIPGDMLKGAAAVAIVKYLRPRFND
ncbi:biotin transporter BioY [Spirochaeta isovalerica]|uniref:Biotin transporter n=1 Tax=Spirochaeta isovalerica TaxID=150 RepID=A0A841RG35_9SPIO|nr:biotin transporter BioY [Spirochaeta isovalerica]MBB6482546.1 biotin transport system substrate-specific component [Spirochaeta isovalerica]